MSLGISPIHSLIRPLCRYPIASLGAIGGFLYLLGFFMFTYNVIMTIIAARELEKEPTYATPMAG